MGGFRGIIEGNYRRRRRYLRIPFVPALESIIRRGEVFTSLKSSLSPDTGELGRIVRARREAPFAARNNEKAHGFGACERSGRECGLTVYGSFLLFTVLITVYFTDN